MNIFLVVGLVLIVSTIAYFPFAIYNIFVSKKQITMSFIDLIYLNLIGCSLPFIYEDLGRLGVVIIIIAFIVWSLILTYGITKNDENHK